MKKLAMAMCTVLLLSACGQQTSNNQDTIDSTLNATGQVVTENQPQTSDSTGGGAARTAQTDQPIPAQRQLIRKAQIRLKPRDYSNYAADVRKLLAPYQAWVVREDESGGDYGRQGSMDIRVPVQQFDALMAALEKTKAVVLEKSISTEDVTNAIVDVEGRIKAKQAARDRYMALLTKANTMQEVLEVQEKIDEITETLESAAHNLAHMKAEAAYSTISLVYVSEENESISRPGFGSRLWDALADGWQGAGNLLIGLVAFWPFWLLIGSAIWLFRRWRKRGKKTVA